MVKKYKTVTGEERKYSYEDDRCKKCQNTERAHERARRRALPRCECGGALYNQTVEYEGTEGLKRYTYITCRKCNKTHNDGTSQSN